MIAIGKKFRRVGREVYFGVTPAKLAGVIAGANDKTTTDTLDQPFDDDLKRLTQYQNNFFRHWMIPYWNYSPPKPRDCVFARSGDKWDLTKYNDDYLSRLTNLILDAGEAGVAVQLVLFDRSGLDVSNQSEKPVRRWEDSPWNINNNVNGVIKADPGQTGLSAFFQDTRPLRTFQETYIRSVVGRTKSWNVFYEIMNEPMGAPPEVRVRWADWVVGVINSVTRGENLIFYNDHTAYPRGADVNLWKQMNLPNYNNFHGVIFHGQTPLRGMRRVAPTDFDPDSNAYGFRGEKIVQISTDGGPTGERDQYPPNKEWCDYVFRKGMMLQAHTTNSEAARGIGDCGPTRIRYNDREPPHGGIDHNR